MIGKGIARARALMTVGASKRPTAKENVAGPAMAAVSDERGDVPGWVLITLMTAGLVIIIWGLAGPALSGVFEQAIERVSSF
ncbi:hypothetical protein [Humibacter albus]|uniref:hypothetical protein n=1 Tax=Humibacter albus TaxID=427754 RepID=UPI0003B3E048|nr:hypothetical protein [Humibacter albus]